jgi:hypothetical protein
MNDWSRSTVDLNEEAKLGAEKRNYPKQGEDNSVCPLTNTHHEWPDKSPSV